MEETFRAGIGECDALCNFATMAMRAVGIPVVVQTTTWTKMDLAHSWCAVLQDGEFYDFSPAYAGPDEYRQKLMTVRYLKPAKSVPATCLMLISKNHGRTMVIPHT